jgi:hypothetical protein
MIEVGIVKLIVNMVESQNIDAENSAADALLSLACHGVITAHCMTVKLTNSIQRTSELP